MGSGDAPFTGQDPRPRVDWRARAEKAEAELARLRDRLEWVRWHQDQCWLLWDVEQEGE